MERVREGTGFGEPTGFTSKNASADNAPVVMHGGNLPIMDGIASEGAKMDGDSLPAGRMVNVGRTDVPRLGGAVKVKGRIETKSGPVKKSTGEDLKNSRMASL